MTTTAAPLPVTAAAGMPETRLPDSLVARLPGHAPPAPWATRCDVTTWWHRPHRDSLDALPEAVRPERLLVIAWALVRYSDTPVGPYSELVAAPIARGRVAPHIPFIVVDSPASVVGGRVNWLLPKALAAFAWNGRVVRVSASEPATPSWDMTISTRPLGPPVPIGVRFAAQQVTVQGEVRRFPARVCGLARYASIEVDGHADGPLASLLRTGRFNGAAVTRGRFTASSLD